MSTKAEKIEAQARAYSDHRHAVGPVELRKLMEAQEILKELIPEFEVMAKDFGSKWETDMPGCADLIRRAKEVV